MRLRVPLLIAGLALAVACGPEPLIDQAVPAEGGGVQTDGFTKSTSTFQPRATTTTQPSGTKDVTNPTQRRELLQQWYTALEARRGSHFLLPLNTTPGVTGSTWNPDDVASRRTGLQQWFNALENWRGTHFLLTVGTGASGTFNPSDPASLRTGLKQWHSALEGWQGVHFLVTPA